MPDGSFARFRVIESPVMAPELAAQFPEIKTYRGQGVDDPQASLRLLLFEPGDGVVITIAVLLAACLAKCFMSDSSVPTGGFSCIAKDAFSRCSVLLRAVACWLFQVGRLLG
ncbi:MAG: hypothetical protein A2X46_10640 [Lentisphaerae bacterium GWF2_57_35]|nr:MAG: hypothetical protein A2X46_10640 [Lentisphaerae bacterium GWF2_57_35]